MFFILVFFPIYFFLDLFTHLLLSHISQILFPLLFLLFFKQHYRHIFSKFVGDFISIIFKIVVTANAQIIPPYPIISCCFSIYFQVIKLQIKGILFFRVISYQLIKDLLCVIAFVKGPSLKFVGGFSFLCQGPFFPIPRREQFYNFLITLCLYNNPQ